MAKKKDDRPNMVEQFAEFKELKNKIGRQN